jgi:mRNA interferase RelE/StbE
MAKYSIKFKKSAEKELGGLPKPYLSAVIQKIKKLEDDPRSLDSRKLTNYDLWRMRHGDYRIIYLIDDSKHEVEIFKIGHRKEVYRF